MATYPAFFLTANGDQANAFAPYSAPSGYQWEFVTDNGQIVYDGSDPVVNLIQSQQEWSI